jgi:isopentenyl-diphosphate delta-isomerase
MNDELILVDENDSPLGKMDKLLVHQKGLLHRAFSVFIFNSKGELLLQQRADTKYHSGGLWTNTCCSHPRYGEELSEAVERRLMEEMGMKCETEFAFSFIYFAAFENGLSEHELDHVFVGTSDIAPTPNSAEVKNWKYINLASLEKDIEKHPKNYSEWMKICLPRLKTYVETKELVSK